MTMPSVLRGSSMLTWLALGIVLFLFPYFHTWAGFSWFIDNLESTTGINLSVFQVTMFGVWLVILMGLNILTGYSGQISLGHGALVAAGAYITAILLDRTATPLAVAISGALYALVHLRDSSWTAATYRELFGLFLLGGVLALSYLRTRQLYFAIGLHAALAYGARVNKLVIQIPDASLSWLTGTSRLINGVVSWIVLLCLGGLLVWWTRAPRAGKGDREGMGS